MTDDAYHRTKATMTDRKAPHDALPLRTVSRLTGLTPDVIRAWEKRYGVVEPRRGPRGARLYVAADVARLRLLRDVVRTGRTIGDVAHLGSAELTHLARQTGARREPEIAAALPTVQAAVAALQRFDTAALHRVLSEALVALGASQFCRRIAAPLLDEVGRCWADGRLSIADEHLLSAAMRNLLGGIAQQRAITTEPVVMLTSPRGERHELGLLLAALTAADAGVAPYYLGVDLPADQIVAAARRARAAVVGLTIVNGENERVALEEVRAIEGGLPAATELWLGGAHAAALAARLTGSRANVLHDADALDDELARLSASGPGLGTRRAP